MVLTVKIPADLMSIAADVANKTHLADSKCWFDLRDKVASALNSERNRHSDFVDERPTLRDCPMCHASGDDDEKVYLTKEVMIAKDVEYANGYSVRCIECGVSISDEHKDEVVRLWNGQDKPVDED